MDWAERDLYDANGAKIGTIAGTAFARRKFGTAWLLVETATPGRALVPEEQIQSSRGRLVLPYPRAYVEMAPAISTGGALTPAEERSLRLHYGLGGATPGSQCQACGLCMASRRLKQRRKAK
jgi:hypothetical protein